MRSSTTIVALAALTIGEVMAGPAHAHLHRNKRDNDGWKDVDFENINWSAVGVNWATVDYSGASETTAPALSATTTAPSVASAAQSTTESSPSSASSTSSSSHLSSSDSALDGLGSWLFQDLWNDLEGVSNTLSAFGSSTSPSGSDVGYIGNVGQPYGSVVMLVPSTDGYDYTITVKNAGSSSKSMNLWLKSGKDGAPNSGATSATEETTLTFNLPEGQSQVIALAQNVQGAIAESTDAKGNGGCFGTAWLEFNTAAGWPAWDCSWIQDNDKSYPMYATADGTDCVSSKTQSSWMTDTQQVGSGDCALNGDSAHITLTVGADP